MFILPIFPDDILCFVAGLSTMTWKYFIVMQLISRAISVVLTSLSVAGLVIPYTEWWGILCWILIGIAIVALFILLYKKGDAIEKWFLGLFRSKKDAASDRAAQGGTDEAHARLGPAVGKKKAPKKRASSSADRRKKQHLTLQSGQKTWPFFLTGNILK